MTNPLDALLRDLRGVKDVNAHYRAIDDLVANGDYALVVNLTQAIEQRLDFAAPPWALESIFDRVVRSLALHPALGAAKAALHIGLAARTQSTQRPRSPLSVARELAFLLASGQTPATLLAMLAEFEQQPELDEVLACWVQERVVRDHDFCDEPCVTGLWSRLQAAGHPLADLPLRLERVESDLRKWLPQERVNGSGCAIPFGPSVQKTSKARAAVQCVECTELPAPPHIAAVVVNWSEESGGRSESRRFRLAPAIEAGAVNAAFLNTLPLECLDGAADSDVRLRAVPVEHALCVLFAASANGGAYNRGRRAAYGRLELWSSVAGMLGQQGLDVASLATQATNWAWFTFDADGRWFERVAWDLGVAALSADGTELCVLAATDTD